MNKVEKFKELLKKYDLIVGAYNCGHADISEVKKAEQELIKMYSELEEPQEKPVIKFKELYVDMNPKYGYEIQFVSLKNNEVKTYKYSLTLEEKDGMLITDDFIFIKD